MGDPTADTTTAYEMLGGEIATESMQQREEVLPQLPPLANELPTPTPVDTRRRAL